MTITAELERIRHQYLNKIVETQAIRDFKESIDVFGKKIGPLSKGNHYKMEFWIAKSFLKRDIIRLVGRDESTEGEEVIGKLDVQEIQKIAFDQGRSHEINDIGKNLFTAIKEFLDVLSYRVKMKLTPEKKYKTLFSNIQDLIMIRHRRILNLSHMKQSLKVTQNLTQEEKILMDNLTDNLITWKNFFQNNKRKDS